MRRKNEFERVLDEAEKSLRKVPLYLRRPENLDCVDCGRPEVATVHRIPTTDDSAHRFVKPKRKRARR